MKMFDKEKSNPVLSKGIFSSRRLRLMLTLLILALFAVYFFANIDKFRPLVHINPWFLVIIGSVNLIFLFTSGLLTRYLLQPFGKYISFFEATYIALFTSVGNFFAPVGTGLVIRAYYLKQKHKVPYGDYISILTGNYFIVFLVNLFFGLVSLLFLKSHAGSHYWLLVFGFSASLLFFISLTTLRIKESIKNNFNNSLIRGFLSLVIKISEGWQKILDHPGLLGKLLGLSTVNLFITILYFWLIITSLHLSTGFAALLLFGVFSVLSFFINITPANLGVKEALYIFSAGALGFTVPQIILIVVIDRGVSFIIMFVSYVVLRFKRSSFINSPIVNS